MCRYPRAEEQARHPRFEIHWLMRHSTFPAAKPQWCSSCAMLNDLSSPRASNLAPEASIAYA